MHSTIAKPLSEGPSRLLGWSGHFGFDLTDLRKMATALLNRPEFVRAYVQQPKPNASEEKTGTFSGTFSGDEPNYQKDLASPTGFEPVLSA